MVQAFIQQAINRKLKTEYLSVTLPSDETIPEGLVIACYNDIPVVRYKNVLSKASLPAMPISLRKNMGVYFVGPATAGNSTPIPATQNNPFIIIESITDGANVINGSVDDVTGLESGSSIITCNSFAGKYITMIRGTLPIPSINPSDGSEFYIKALSSTSIVLNTPLVSGEYLRIEGHVYPDTVITTLTVESIIGTSVVITGPSAIVLGLAVGSNSIISDGFSGKMVTIVRGSATIPGINPGDGSNYFTKVQASNTISLSSPLSQGEYLKIQTL